MPSQKKYLVVFLVVVSFLLGLIFIPYHTNTVNNDEVRGLHSSSSIDSEEIISIFWHDITTGIYVVGETFVNGELWQQYSIIDTNITPIKSSKGTLPFNYLLYIIIGVLIIMVIVLVRRYKSMKKLYTESTETMLDKQTSVIH